MRERPVRWQKILAQGFSSAQELLAFLDLPASLASDKAADTFKMRVPRGFAARMQPGNANDPLLQQVLAIAAETTTTPGYSVDPLAELQANLIPGLIHKYAGRVLLMVTGVCAVHCRYCFRRHFPYQANNLGHQGVMAAISYIQNNPTIKEVIFSGGDPLVASDKFLSKLVYQLERIDHVQTLRIHTRLPIVLPERINNELLTWLNASRLQKVIVIHCNHAQEIDTQVKHALLSLKAAGCYLLNQSVLLKNVNDCSSTLANLSNVLFECGVLPYYLHLLDKIAGAAHFDLPLTQAQDIYQQLQLQLPGYLLPRLVFEQAGQLSKTLVF